MVKKRRNNMDIPKKSKNIEKYVNKLAEPERLYTTPKVKMMLKRKGIPLDRFESMDKDTEVRMLKRILKA